LSNLNYRDLHQFVPAETLLTSLCVRSVEPYGGEVAIVPVLHNKGESITRLIIVRHHEREPQPVPPSFGGRDKRQKRRCEMIVSARRSKYERELLGLNLATG